MSHVTRTTGRLSCWRTVSATRGSFPFSNRMLAHRHRRWKRIGMIDEDWSNLNSKWVNIRISGFLNYHFFGILETRLIVDLPATIIDLAFVERVYLSSFAKRCTDSSRVCFFGFSRSRSILLPKLALQKSDELSYLCLYRLNGSKGIEMTACYHTIYSVLVKGA
jgi:hypothetical protein